MSQHQTPQSPEEYPPDVREELDQYDVSHEGRPRTADAQETMSSHLGAQEQEPTPVTPPMAGPERVTEGEVSDDMIDPREELTGG